MLSQRLDPRTTPEGTARRPKALQHRQSEPLKFSTDTRTPSPRAYRSSKSSFGNPPRKLDALLRQPQPHPATPQLLRKEPVNPAHDQPITSGMTHTKTMRTPASAHPGFYAGAASRPPSTNGSGLLRDLQPRGTPGATPQTALFEIPGIRQPRKIASDPAQSRSESAITHTSHAHTLQYKEEIPERQIEPPEIFGIAACAGEIVKTR